MPFEDIPNNFRTLGSYTRNVRYTRNIGEHPIFWVNRYPMIFKTEPGRAWYKKTLGCSRVSGTRWALALPRRKGGGSPHLLWPVKHPCNPTPQQWSKQRASGGQNKGHTLECFPFRKPIMERHDNTEQLWSKLWSWLWSWVYLTELRLMQWESRFSSPVVYDFNQLIYAVCTPPQPRPADLDQCLTLPRLSLAVTFTLHCE